jgi:hypothetical protein
MKMDQAGPLSTTSKRSCVKLLSATLPLCLLVALDHASAWAGGQNRFAFENATNCPPGRGSRPSMTQEPVDPRGPKGK